MKNRIHKILGIGLALVLALALVAGFALPAGAAVETINEWYEFEYPIPGADGDWFYDPSITRLGEITEAIDGTLYVHVQRCVPDATFTITTGTITVTEFGTSNTGTITADIDGTWDVGSDPVKTAAFEAAFLPTDFVAWSDISGMLEDTMCISGTVTAINLSFTGSIEDMSGAALDSISGDIIGGVITVDSCGSHISGGGASIWIDYGFLNGLGEAIFKSTDEGRTWEATDYPGGWVVDMAASSIDADSLYVVDGYYVYNTDDAGDTWSYVKKDSLEEQLSGWCGIPACCYCGHDYCYAEGFVESPPRYCPSCTLCDGGYYLYTCPITSIDVTYDDNENPYVFIGTRKHCSGIDLDEADGLDQFPGEVYWISETAFPSTWSALGLYCYRNGTYDALAVGCAPDWADTNETYVVVSTDDDNGDGTPCSPPATDSQTHVVYTTGGPCDWPEVAELLWNCVTTNHFGSRYAARIAFPDDWEDTDTLFVGVVDCEDCTLPDTTDITTRTGGPGGDVYMVMVTSPLSPAIDMNVLGITSGCVGIQPVDIISLDIEGDSDEARLIAGAFCCNKVYCSEDGGWSWDASAKDPTGAWLTYAIWYEDTALAVTAGCGAAVSMCCGEDYPCEFWNQISLISTGIDCVRWIDHSPGYVCGDSETMFMLTDWDWCDYWEEFWDAGPLSDCCCFPCQLCDPAPNGNGVHPTCYDQTQSVWRYDGTYWERVYSSTIAGANVCCETGDPAGCIEAENIFWRLQVSPDFNETNVVYLWDGCFEMWRTTDAGCSWDKLTFPCAPRPCIREAVVIDEDTVIAGSHYSHACCAVALGTVYKTTRHGARPWAEYEYNVTAPGAVVSFDLEAGYEDPGWVLLGDDANRVFISEDGGEEWDLVGAGTTTGCAAVLTGTNTFVAFDPDYATNDTIYAAAGDIIARCVIDPDVTWAKQEWAVLCDHAGVAAGIKAVGDTVLYVTDRSSTDECDVWPDPDLDCTNPAVAAAYPCCCDDVADEGGVLRSLNPLDDVKPKNKVIFERIAKGLPLLDTTDPDDKAQLIGLWLTCDTSDDGCAENVLWTLEAGEWGDPPDDCENIWVYEDTLAAPVVLDMPVDGRKLPTTTEVTLSWNELCGADCYEVSLWKYCAECPDEKLVVPLKMDCAPGECCFVCGPAAAVDVCACEVGECPCTTDICIVVKYDADGNYILESGTTYYWQVRVCQCQPTLSKWSEERSFSTALLGVPFIDLCSPACGSQDIILTPNFAWGPVTGATGYDIELATTETFTAGVVRGSSTVNAWVLTEPLEYATTYYWRVRAEKDGIFSGWTVCMFTTMEEPVVPPPPVVVEPTPPAPVVPTPIIEFPPTPSWVWAIIGIGTALVVVVIVLTVRTRRPPA